MYQRAATTDGAPTVGTLKDASIEFDMVWDRRCGFTAIKDAFFNGTAIELAVMDGLITGVGSSGSQGLRATLSNPTFSRNEALEEAITVSVTAKPTYSVNPPTWMVIP